MARIKRVSTTLRKWPKASKHYVFGATLVAPNVDIRRAIRDRIFCCRFGSMTTRTRRQPVRSPMALARASRLKSRTILCSPAWSSRAPQPALTARPVTCKADRRAYGNEVTFERVRYFNSNFRTADHAPELPGAPLARTRHHRRCVGSALMVICDSVAVWLATSGAAKPLESSISIV
jgi:hypothetical protein